MHVAASLAAALLILFPGSTRSQPIRAASVGFRASPGAFHGFPPSPWRRSGPDAAGADRRGDPPELQRNLYRARERVGAESVWKALDAHGTPLTGKGVVVAVFDGDVDVYQPMLLKDDGGTFVWLDVDRSGDFSPGDAVDLNGNGVKDPDETLGWIQSEGITAPDRDTTRFQAGYDFLFQDQDGDGAREYGPPRFGEQDPSYGERLFIMDDADENDRLDPGEVLIGLGTSKVRAIRREATVYRRGENLVGHMPGPGRWHCTPVCGILAGGWPGRHKLTGIAPDADLVIFMEHRIQDLPWARSEGAGIVIDEYGGGLPGNGSGWDESLIDERSREGLIFIAAAGNGRGRLQHVLLAGGEPRVYLSDGSLPRFTWIGDPPRLLHLENPLGREMTLPIVDGEYDRDGFDFLVSVYDAFRGGTWLNLIPLAVPQSGRNGARWVFSFPGEARTIHGYAFVELPTDTLGWPDDDGRYTVQGLGLADSAITVADWDSDLNDDVAWFSGSGPRIDGYPVLDIAAPGIRILAPAAPPDSAHQVAFAPFSGTSASVPFVGGAAALLKQAFPDMDSGLFRTLLTKGAGRDSTTTDRDLWGAGRLDIQGALAAGLAIAARSGTRHGLALTVGPNPTAGPSRITWESSGVFPAEVRVFSVDGRLVWERTLPPTGGRSASVEWGGTDLQGLPAAQGVYFALVRDGDRTGTARIVRLR